MSRRQKDNKIKNWLDKSPIATLFVVLAAITGFVISSVNGIYTIYNNYRKHHIRPSIEIRALTPYLQSTYVSSGEFFNMPVMDKELIAGGEPILKLFDRNLKLEVFVLSSLIRIKNPCSAPVTMLNFKIYFQLKDSQIIWSSKRYTTGELQTDKEIVKQMDLPIFTRANSLQDVYINFIIPPGDPEEEPNLWKFFENKTELPISFYLITCEDEKGNVYSVRK